MFFYITVLSFVYVYSTNHQTRQIGISPTPTKKAKFSWILRHFAYIQTQRLRCWRCGISQNATPRHLKMYETNMFSSAGRTKKRRIINKILHKEKFICVCQQRHPSCLSQNPSKWNYYTMWLLGVGGIEVGAAQPRLRQTLSAYLNRPSCAVHSMKYNGKCALCFCAVCFGHTIYMHRHPMDPEKNIVAVARLHRLFGRVARCMIISYI